MTLLGNRFELLHRIGAGGMAEVYCARDRRLGRDVAIKLLNAACSRDPGILERFRHESSALARLSHPNIVTLLDTGETEDGRFYLVMERLRGESLSDLFRRLRGRGELPSWRRLVGMIRQVCQALQAAHAQQIVHRDIKPSNLFRLEDWPEGEDMIKILDFGIAKFLADSNTGDEERIQLTASGHFVGTAHYAAPEAIEPELFGPVDGRADVYGLGVILYQGVTGKLPYDGQPRAAVLYKTAFEEPPSLRTRAPQVPEAIEAIVMRCIARQPHDRFAGVRELGEALAAVAEAKTLLPAESRSVRVHGLRDELPFGPVAGPALPRGDVPATAGGPRRGEGAAARPGAAADGHLPGGEAPEPKAEEQERGAKAGRKSGWSPAGLATVAEEAPTRGLQETPQMSVAGAPVAAGAKAESPARSARLPALAAGRPGASQAAMPGPAGGQEKAAQKVELKGADAASGAGEVGPQKHEPAGAVEAGSESPGGAGGSAQLPVAVAAQARKGVGLQQGELAGGGAPGQVGAASGSRAPFPGAGASEQVGAASGSRAQKGELPGGGAPGQVGAASGSRTPVGGRQGAEKVEPRAGAATPVGARKEGPRIALRGSARVGAQTDSLEEIEPRGDAGAAPPVGPRTALRGASAPVGARKGAEGPQKAAGSDALAGGADGQGAQRSSAATVGPPVATPEPVDGAQARKGGSGAQKVEPPLAGAGAPAQRQRAQTMGWSGPERAMARDAGPRRAQDAGEALEGEQEGEAGAPRRVPPARRTVRWEAASASIRARAVEPARPSAVEVGRSGGPAAEGASSGEGKRPDVPAPWQPPPEVLAQPRLRQPPTPDGSPRLSRSETIGAAALLQGQLPPQTAVVGAIGDEPSSVTEPGPAGGVANASTGSNRVYDESGQELETPVPWSNPPIQARPAQGNLGMIVAASLLLGVIVVAWWFMPEPPPARISVETWEPSTGAVTGGMDDDEEPPRPAAPPAATPAKAVDPGPAPADAERNGRGGEAVVEKVEDASPGAAETEAKDDPAAAQRTEQQLVKALANFQATVGACANGRVLIGVGVYAIAVTLEVVPPRREPRVVEARRSKPEYRAMPNEARQCVLAALRKLRVGPNPGPAKVEREFLIQ